MFREEDESSVQSLTQKTTSTDASSIADMLSTIMSNDGDILSKKKKGTTVKGKSHKNSKSKFAPHSKVVENKDEDSGALACEFCNK